MVLGKKEGNNTKNGKISYGVIIGEMAPKREKVMG